MEKGARQSGVDSRMIRPAELFFKQIVSIRRTAGIMQRRYVSLRHKSLNAQVMLACINEFRHLYREEVDDMLRRMISYGSLPAEESADKLRTEVSGIERRILVITGDHEKGADWHRLEPHDVRYVETLLCLRHIAMTRLFAIHYSQKEADDIERIDARLREMTDEMRGLAETWEKANSAEGGAEATGRLLYSKYTVVPEREYDGFYGSDFGRIIPVIAYINECGDDDTAIVECHTGHGLSRDRAGRELPAWYEEFVRDRESAPRQRPGGITFCEATRRIVTEKLYSFPDFIKLSRFQIDVEAHGRWTRKIQ